MSDEEIVKELENIKDCVHGFSRGTVYDMIHELIVKIETEL